MEDYILFVTSVLCTTCHSLLILIIFDVTIPILCEHHLFSGMYTHPILYSPISQASQCNTYLLKSNQHSPHQNTPTWNDTYCPCNFQFDGWHMEVIIYLIGDNKKSVFNTWIVLWHRCTTSGTTDRQVDWWLTNLNHSECTHCTDWQNIRIYTC